MTVESSMFYCEGCGEAEPLDPYEYEGRILMLCDDCIKAVDDVD